MFLKGFGKLSMTAILTLLVFFLAASPLWAFSVDMKSFYYYDQFDAVSPARTINYDFSAGTLSDNTIAIPDSFVTKKPADDGLSFFHQGRGNEG